MKKLVTCLGVAASLAWTAQSATITWGDPVNISGDLDVYNQNVIAAMQLGSTGGAGGSLPAPVTVNGVTFTDSDSHFAFNNWAAYNQVFDPAGTAGDAYHDLLDSALYIQQGNGDGSIRINGLTSGQTYLVQLWANDGRSGIGDNRFTHIIDANGTTLKTLAERDANTSRGQYIIGTFTADASGYQDIFIDDQDYPVVNAILLAETNIPEPATLGMIGLLGGAILFVRRRIVM